LLTEGAVDLLGGHPNTQASGTQDLVLTNVFAIDEVVEKESIR